MFKQNRCYDKTMGSTYEASFAFDSNMKTQDYPQAMANPEMPMMGQYMNQANPGCALPPVYECPQERVCHREFVHEVPHICPINTKIVNHHIYRHTYTPCYTCCEENVCCDVYEGSCCNF